MNKQLQFVLIVLMYVSVFGIGLYIIIAGKDWRGYVALISTPLLHTIVKTLGKYLTPQKSTQGK
jgi:hypothetical protein